MQEELRLALAEEERLQLVEEKMMAEANMRDRKRLRSCGCIPKALA